MINDIDQNSHTKLHAFYMVEKHNIPPTFLFPHKSNVADVDSIHDSTQTLKTKTICQQGEPSISTGSLSKTKVRAQLGDVSPSVHHPARWNMINGIECRKIVSKFDTT